MTSHRPPPKPKPTRQVDQGEIARLAEASKGMPDCCAAAAVVESLRKELYEMRARFIAIEKERDHFERRLSVVADLVERTAKQVARIAESS